MRKIKYSNESNISFMLCFLIAAFVFVFVISYMKDMVLYGFSRKNIINVIELLVIFLIMVFVGFKTKIDVKENKKRYKLIKENGKKYQGKVTGIIEDDETSDESTYYKLSVKYFNEEHGKYNYLITPTINIKPKNIDNMICDVYVYENEAIADNFSGYEITNVLVNLVQILAIILTPVIIYMILNCFI